MTDFSWFSDDAVAVRGQGAIAVYQNPHGEIVIRQQQWPDDDPFILIGRDHIPALIAALLKAAKDAGPGNG